MLRAIGGELSAYPSEMVVVEGYGDVVGRHDPHDIPPDAGDGEVASAAEDPRFDRLLSIEQSIVDAKRALFEAEIAMQAVHAGLACVPMPEPPVELAEEIEPPRVSVWSRWFGSADSSANIHFAVVPLGVQALALIMLGWLAMGAAFKIMGPEQARAVVATLRSATIGVPMHDRPLAVEAAYAHVDERIGASRSATGDGAVVIYERNSPYPAHFAGIAAKDRNCLAEAIYYESRGEPVAGQIAVAQVVLNRTLAGSWPRTVCAVTNQGEENGEKCQFSYACMRSRLGKPHGDPWDNAQGLAEEILAGGAWLEEMLDATHFHRSDLKPIWRLSLVEVGRFGRHTFYNSPTENRSPLSRLAVR